MPQFVIAGDPAAVRASAATMAEKGAAFRSVAQALESVSTGGWTGRAAEARGARADLLGEVLERGLHAGKPLVDRARGARLRADLQLEMTRHRRPSSDRSIPPLP